MGLYQDFATISSGEKNKSLKRSGYAVSQKYDMDSNVVDTLKHVTNTEVIRRLLIKYFIDHGFGESFDRSCFPSLVQDLPFVIPVLSNKIEIVPHAAEVDPSQGKAKLGWNMFVLGNHRMYLGETYHNNLGDLARQIRSGYIRGLDNQFYAGSSARRQTTPRRIVTFITRVLGDHQGGYVDLRPGSAPPRPPGEPYAAKMAMTGMPQTFMTRSGFGT